MAAEGLAMTCDEVDELAGAYALSALPDEELQAVEGHLASCANPHALLRDLSETAALLPLLSEPAMPPPELGARIRAAALDEIEPPSRQGRELVRAASPDVLPFRRRFAAVLPYALAAALALVAFGLGWYGIAQHNALAEQRASAHNQEAVLAALTSGLAPGSAIVKTPAASSLPSALIVQPADGSPAYLLVNWPQPAQGKSYQAWLINQGQQPVSAGVFDGSTGGIQVIRLSRPIAGSQVFAVTVEPHGGSPQPTSRPFLISNLSS